MFTCAFMFLFLSLFLWVVVVILVVFLIVLCGKVLASFVVIAVIRGISFGRRDGGSMDGSNRRW